MNAGGGTLTLTPPPHAAGVLRAPTTRTVRSWFLPKLRAVQPPDEPGPGGAA